MKLTGHLLKSLSLSACCLVLPLASAHADTSGFADGYTLQGISGTRGPSTANNSTTLQLTTQGGGPQSNGYFTSSSQGIGNGFSATFQYQVTNTNGGNPADGFTFTLQSSSPLSLGGAGGNLGYMAGDSHSAITPSVALAFSIYSGNHANTVALGTNGTFDLGGTTANSITGFSLNTGDVIRMNLTYTATTHTLGLAVQDLTTSSAVQNIAYTVDIAGVLSGNNLPDGQAYVGFTGGTADFSATQQFSAFSFTSTNVVPEPSTWALLGTGAVGLGFVTLRRRRHTAGA